MVRVETTTKMCVGSYPVLRLFPKTMHCTIWLKLGGEGVQVRKVTIPTLGHEIRLLPASTPAMVLGRSDEEGGPQSMGLQELGD